MALRTALAKSLLPEEVVTVGQVGQTTSSGAAVGTTTGKGDTKVVDGEDDWGSGGGGVKIVGGERRLSRVRILMRVTWQTWHDVYNEVIDPLAQEGADMMCEVIVATKGDCSIRENTVGLGIKESLIQRGLNSKIETE